MKRVTNINYTIFDPDGSVVVRGCIKKFFSGAFNRMVYLKKLHGSLVKFNPSNKNKYEN